MIKGIPNLTEERLSAIKDALAVRAVNRMIYEFNPLVKRMNKLGFRRSRPANYGSKCCTYFIHHKWNLIVKESYFTSRKPRCAIPTYSLAKTYIDPGYDKKKTYSVVIQPKADVSYPSIEMAYNKLRNKFEHDIHRGNVGLFNGKPVMFDW